MSSEATSHKKRKRHSEVEKTSKKKRHVDGSPATAAQSSGEADSIKVKHVEKDDNWEPVIVSTPGFIIPSGMVFKPYRKEDNGELLLHSSKRAKLDYTARENQEGGIQDQLKHYVAIYDPEQNEVQIVEAKNMTVRASLRAEEQAVREAQSASKDMPENKVDRAGLNMEFGTRKAQKAIESKAQNLIKSTGTAEAPASREEALKSIKANPVKAALLESMAEAAANAPTKEDLAATIDEAKPRPKHNPNAKKVKHVYNVKEIMGEDVIRAVKAKPWFEATEAGNEVETLSLFVSRRLQRIINDEDDDNNDEEDEEDESNYRISAVLKVKILRWMEILLKFRNACTGTRLLKLPKREELNEKVGEDPFLIDAVKSQFVPGKGEMSKWQVDNLMTHFAVFSLIVDDFETDVFDLCEDLGFNVSQISKYFKEVGARLANMSEIQRIQKGLSKAEASVHKIAKLVLPLEFPKPKIPRAEKRR